jgi:hypothetical protein
MMTLEEFETEAVGHFSRQEYKGFIIPSFNGPAHIENDRYIEGAKNTFNADYINAVVNDVFVKIFYNRLKDQGISVEDLNSFFRHYGSWFRRPYAPVIALTIYDKLLYPQFFIITRNYHWVKNDQKEFIFDKNSFSYTLYVANGNVSVGANSFMFPTGSEAMGKIAEFMRYFDTFKTAKSLKVSGASL